MAQRFEMISGEYDFEKRLTSWHLRDPEGNFWRATGTAFRFEGIAFEGVENEAGERVGERMVCPRDGILCEDAVWRRERGN